MTNKTSVQKQAILALLWLIPLVGISVSVWTQLSSNSSETPYWSDHVIHEFTAANLPAMDTVELSDQNMLAFHGKWLQDSHVLLTAKSETLYSIPIQVPSPGKYLFKLGYTSAADYLQAGATVADHTVNLTTVTPKVASQLWQFEIDLSSKNTSLDLQLSPSAGSNLIGLDFIYLQPIAD